MMLSTVPRIIVAMAAPSLSRGNPHGAECAHNLQQHGQRGVIDSVAQQRTYTGVPTCVPICRPSTLRGVRTRRQWRLTKGLVSRCNCGHTRTLSHGMPVMSLLFCVPGKPRSVFQAADTWIRDVAVESQPLRS